LALAARVTPVVSQPSTWPNKLMIAITCGELGYNRFWLNMATVHGYGWHLWKGLFVGESNLYVAAGRTRLVMEALKVRGWDRLLFLDTDHDFPADVLWKHAHYTQPLVGGSYVQRKVDQPFPVVYRWNEDRTEMLRPPLPELYKMIAEPGMYKVDVVPTGCLSIRRDVLERWPADVQLFTNPMQENQTLIGEDTWFCRKAQDQGYDIWIDTSLAVSHYSLFPIDQGFFLKWCAHQLKEQVA
jgi:hypothetical protein